MMQYSKHTNAVLTAAALFLLGGCHEQELPPPSLPTTTPAAVLLNLSATRPEVCEAPQSRAVLENGSSRWESGDSIAVYAASYASSGTAQAMLHAVSLTDDGSGARFSGTVPEPAQTDTYYAAYPASAAVGTTSAVFTISATQSSTDRPQLMMMARSADAVPRDGLVLPFAAANAFVHVSLGETVTGLTSVVFESCGGETVTGAYTCSFDDGSVRMDPAGGTRITVESPGSDFYIALPAVTLSQGYRLLFCRGSERMIKTYGYDTGKTLNKGAVYGVTVDAFVPVSADLSGVYTNYDVYRRQGAVAANALDGGTIYAESVTVRGVPSKQIDDVTLTLDGVQIPLSYSSAGPGGVVYTVPEASRTVVKTSRKDYAVEATITVNGEKYRTAGTVSLTGLPYTIDFYANSNDNYVATQQGWSLFGHAWLAGAAGSGGGLGLKSLNSYGISPAFNIPGDTNISAHGQFYLYRAGFSRTSYFRADVTDSASVPGQTTTPVSAKSVVLYPAQATRQDFNWNLTFTSTKNRLSLSRAENDDGRIMIYNVYVDYR